MPFKSKLEVKKKVLVISPVPSHPQDAGNRIRIYQLLINLQKLGHDVYFLHIQQETNDDFAMRQTWGSNFYSLPYVKHRSLIERIFRKLRCFLTNYPPYPYAVDDWYDNSINKFLVQLQEKVKFDVVIVEYVFFSKALNNFGKNVIKIIDTHDIFKDRVHLYQNNGQEYGWYSTTAKEERKGLKRADLIIAIQKEEKEYFQNLVEKKVITIGHTVPLRKQKCLTNFNQNSQNILYIASKNEINIHGINYFISQVLPQVTANLPDAQLLVAGNICEALDETDGCTKLGYVDDINKVYDMANVVVNPILFGTGLKIKSIEALGQSKVLITTHEGAKGLEAEANKAFLVANNTTEFSQYIIDVLTDINLSNKLSEKAYLFAKKYNKEVFEPIEKLLGFESKNYEEENCQFTKI